MAALDFIGTNRVTVRRIPGAGVAIRLLDSRSPEPRPGELELDANEWFDLCLMVQACKAAMDFNAEYAPSEGPE